MMPDAGRPPGVLALPKPTVEDRGARPAGAGCTAGGAGYAPSNSRTERALISMAAGGAGYAPSNSRTERALISMAAASPASELTSVCRVLRTCTAP